MPFTDVSPATAAILSFFDDTEVTFRPPPVAPVSLLCAAIFYYFFCHHFQAKPFFLHLFATVPQMGDSL